MFEKLSEAINENIKTYFINGYHNKEFRKDTNYSDSFFILLDNKYAIEIEVNYMDDRITFFLLKLDEGGKIDLPTGYYKFDNGEWKRKFLYVVCQKLGIEFDLELLKQLGKLEQRHNKNKEVIIERVNKEFKAFEFFFREYKNYLPEFDKIK